MPRNLALGHSCYLWPPEDSGCQRLRVKVTCPLGPESPDSNRTRADLTWRKILLPAVTVCRCVCKLDSGPGLDSAPEGHGAWYVPVQPGSSWVLPSRSIDSEAVSKFQCGSHSAKPR